MNKHKKFIKEAYQGKHGTMCQDLKDVILKRYPEFKAPFKVGDWVIGKIPTIWPIRARRITSIGAEMARYNDPSIGEGENNGNGFKWLRKATHEEVESHLKEEAIRRGFKKGITMLCIEGAIGTVGKFLSDPEFKYDTGLDRLDAHFPATCFTVYSDGKWAVPIPDTEKPLTFPTTLTITKEEAERILGKKIT